MPIYEYQCQSCHNHIELLQNINEKGATTVCPKCQSSQLKRLVALPAGFQLKGTGWYATDEKNKHTAPNKPLKKTSSNDSKQQKEAKQEKSE